MLKHTMVLGSLLATLVTSAAQAQVPTMSMDEQIARIQKRAQQAAEKKRAAQEKAKAERQAKLDSYGDQNQELDLEMKRLEVELKKAEVEARKAELKAKSLP